MDEGTLRRLRDAVGAAHVLLDRADVRPYECDGLTGRRVLPAAVVLPGSTAEVAACVRACHDAGIPFVARGAGTGLSGGAVPVAEGVVIALARMNAVLRVDTEGARVTVQPGVTNLQVTAAVADAGLLYAPDPSSRQVCTIGGNVAENSGGAHCMKHGFTVHHVAGVTLVAPDGEVVVLGGEAPDSPGAALLPLVVGSEGTLGIVTEVVLRVVPAPEQVVTLLGAFPAVEAAASAVSAIVAEGAEPAAVEMMDRLCIDAARRAVGADYPDCEALLLVEVDGPASQCRDVSADIDRIMRACGAASVRIASEGAERERMWAGRRAAFAAMGRVSPSYYVQDGVVPRTRLPAVLHGIRALEAEHGLRVGNVFHAGDGNLHPLVCYDTAHPGEAERAATLADAILDLCITAGGSITGEHGVGLDKACAMPRMFDEPSLRVMGRVRAAIDPDDLCNPGKALPTPRLCGEVPGVYRPHPLERAGVAQRM